MISKEKMNTYSVVNMSSISGTHEFSVLNVTILFQYCMTSVHSPMKGATPVPGPIRITGTEGSFGSLKPVFFLRYNGTWKHVHQLPTAPLSILVWKYLPLCI
jgi:hypothetical protein